MSVIINETSLKKQLTEYLKEKYPGLDTVDYNVISSTMYEEYRTQIINHRLTKFAMNLHIMKETKDYSNIYEEVINNIFDNVIEDDFVNTILEFMEYYEKEDY